MQPSVTAPGPPGSVPDDRFTTSAIRALLAHARRPDLISLAGGLPDPSLLPVDRLATAAERVLRLRGAAALQYGLTEGEPELRRLVADLGGRHPDEVVVTAGSQQALDLLVAVTCRPGDPVVIENPGYLGARQVLTSRMATPVPVPVDHAGLDVDHLAGLLAAGVRPRLVYLNPNFQNPTGRSLDPERAGRLVGLAERYGFVVAADDPYRDLWFDQPPVDLPDSPWVVRLFSTSKVMSPGLRVGWLVADRRVATRVAVARQSADLQTSTLSQLLVADLLADDGWLAGHLDRLRLGYRLRRDALVAALGDAEPGPGRGPGGGFFCWVPIGADSRAALPLALEAGVAYVPGAEFRLDAGAAGSDRVGGDAIRLSFSAVGPDRFAPAVARLRACGVLAPEATNDPRAI